MDIVIALVAIFVAVKLLSGTSATGISPVQAELSLAQTQASSAETVAAIQGTSSIAENLIKGLTTSSISSVGTVSLLSTGNNDPGYDSLLADVNDVNPDLNVGELTDSTLDDFSNSDSFD